MSAKHRGVAASAIKKSDELTTLAGLATEISHLRPALEAIDDRFRRLETQLRRRNTN
jgi:hypothetical protein